MCVVIDTSTFAMIFCRSNRKHNEFKPVLDWVVNRNGTIVYGGSKYLAELKKAVSYQKIFNLLKDINKAKKGDDTQIDYEERRIKSIVRNQSFNDPHLAAIVTITKCRIICTYDFESHSYLKNKRIYPRKVKTPYLYTGSRNVSLLGDKNIVTFCKPCYKINKRIKDKFNDTLTN